MKTQAEIEARIAELKKTRESVAERAQATLNLLTGRILELEEQIAPPKPAPKAKKK
jgi:uncharacterized coiled-coil protein SlyX